MTFMGSRPSSLCSGSQRSFTSAQTCPSSLSAARRTSAMTRARLRSSARRRSGLFRPRRCVREAMADLEDVFTHYTHLLVALCRRKPLRRRLALGGTSNARLAPERASATSFRRPPARPFRYVFRPRGLWHFLSGLADCSGACPPPSLRSSRRRARRRAAVSSSRRFSHLSRLRPCIPRVSALPVAFVPYLPLCSLPARLLLPVISSPLRPSVPAVAARGRGSPFALYLWPTGTPRRCTTPPLLLVIRRRQIGLKRGCARLCFLSFFLLARLGTTGHATARTSLGGRILTSPLNAGEGRQGSEHQGTAARLLLVQAWQHPLLPCDWAQVGPPASVSSRRPGHTGPACARGAEHKSGAREILRRTRRSWQATWLADDDDGLLERRAEPEALSAPPRSLVVCCWRSP